ncbi:alkaline phosphatase family protein [Halioglobus maricola]|uniref:Alkaline phosphatase family protein n=1 Tax=Halioglobus maricola TaxID=2601894 RepID=A0A5P9NPT6_9GAMM|nr:alkaline phosphatase family protein [Halioglobus maricola]QFU77294.1 alkaline phosphatase family protein [Halioglobus maricola]
MIRQIGLVVAMSLISVHALADKPRLVLQITVDGMRADLLDRYSKNFGRGGFRYLLEEGAVFTNAHYLHANTETIVGHTTLATGTTPAVHGMVGNVWYHADSGELGYNIEDPDAPLLPTRDDVAAGAQVDPAQLKAGSKGRSPKGILVPGLADTLKISSPASGKAFGISGKDRSAVAMAGKVGTAYWFSTDTGDFQTSSYYSDAYPDWVREWNAAGHTAALADSDWQLTLAAEKYVLADRDNRPYEVDLKGFGKIFPHNYGPANHPLFNTRVLVSPAGDTLLADFGKTLIEAEGLGVDRATDYLSISFSGVDAVNHFFGPSSLENEDTVLRLDQTLAELFKYIDDKVGLEHTLIVFSADHGMAEMPEQASEQGYPAQRLYSDEIVEYAKEQAKALLGNEKVIKDYFRPYFYLDDKELAKLKIRREEAIDILAAALERKDGIGGAIPSARAAALGEMAVAHNHHPTRSGDIYVYPEPHWFMFDRGAIGVMHGSPWAYDTHVPLIFVGPGVRRGSHARLVHPIDVAPTTSALLGILPPAAAEGQVLTEAIAR